MASDTICYDTRIPMNIFIFPAVVAVVAFVGAYLWGGFEALFLVALLAVLETTLSFDNAVVNAKVLQRMSPVWQKRFLVWGIPVAVFGTRFVLPILIVAAAAGLSPVFVTQLAFFDAAQYGAYLEDAHVAIAAFGSAFLLLVSLKYFFNDRKTVHWIVMIERHLSRWGGIEAIEIALVLTVLLACAFAVPGVIWMGVITPVRLAAGEEIILRASAVPVPCCRVVAQMRTVVPA